MSRIDELIVELCPEGVEFSRVGDIATVGTGSSDRKHMITVMHSVTYDVRTKAVTL